LRAAVAAAALCAFALTGCGSSNSVSTVVAAANRTLAAQASANTTFVGATLFGSVRGAVPARGAFAFQHGIGYQAIDLSRLQAAPPRTDYVVFLPNRFYLQPHLASGSALPAGKLWLSTPITGPRSAGRGREAFELRILALNPQFLLDQIAWGTVSASKGKQVVLNHVPYTTHTVTVSLPKAAAGAAGPSAAAMRAAIRDELEAAAAAGDKSGKTEIDVWLDGPGHVAETKAVVPGSELGTISSRLFAFGVPFSATLPPSSTVLPAKVILGPSESLWQVG